jgi:hypothetical protein
MKSNLFVISRIVALLSFVGGTVLMLLYFLIGSGVEVAGFYFVGIAAIINLGLLLALVLTIVSNPSAWREILKTSAILLLNIPVVIVYIWFVSILMNTMRITFVNKTQSNITDIKIIGCGDKFIDHLEVKESKEVWLAIKGDCSINIQYQSAGQMKSEIVKGYVTNNAGKKEVYEIGNNLGNGIP